MPITFDGPNKIINITTPTTFTTVQAIYEDSIEWADEAVNMIYLDPMEATGYEAIGGGVYSDKIYILKNGWKIKPWSGDYSLIIQGSLITDDETRRSVSPDSGNVDIVFQVATFGTVTQVISGSGVTEQDKLDIAEDVWEHAKGDTVYTDAEIMRKIETNRWKITSNQFIVYDDDGITPIYTFNLKDKQGRPTESQPYERVPV